MRWHTYIEVLSRHDRCVANHDCRKRRGTHYIGEVYRFARCRILLLRMRKLMTVYPSDDAADRRNDGGYC